ncbi:MAG: nicotinate-nucleotide adenylyltransferase, partial [Bacteroidetes bacterium]|nr:nicotinate-nucleotide adenylyltransferase [Bacteroidota bacterium]
MKKLFLALIAVGLTIQTFSQVKTEALEEIAISGVNYKYLNAIGDSKVAIPVKVLEKKVATFDLK